MLKCVVKILRIIITETRERSVQEAAAAIGFRGAEGTGPRVEWDVDRNEEEGLPGQTRKGKV